MAHLSDVLLAIQYAGGFPTATQVKALESGTGAIRDNVDNISFIVDAYRHWTVYLFDSPFDKNLKDPNIIRVLHRWLRYLKTVPYTDAIGPIVKLGNALFSNTVHSLQDVKSILQSSWAAFPLKKEMIALLKDPSLTVLRSYLFRWTIFLKKGPYVNPSLHTDALRKWYADEADLKKVNLSNPTTRYWISYVRKIIKAWLKEYRVSVVLPAHGPGSTAGYAKASLEKKLHDTLPNWKTLMLLRSAKVTDGTAVDFGLVYPLTGERIQDRRSVPRSEVIFVPKNSTSMRTICKMPADIMYIEQAVKSSLYDWIHNHIGTIANLEDQTSNQKLAEEGSRNKRFATIDLSSASDRISWPVIQALFRGLPLFKWLAALRVGEYSLPDGSVTSVEKYAPMGSALAFPIQTIVFSAIVEAVVSALGVTEAYSGRVKGPNEDLARRNYRVYGDDIIVPEPAVQTLMSVLELFGFKVNVEKSFFGDHPARESCGYFGYNGVNVSPLFYRIRGLDNGGIRPGDIAARIKLANACLEIGALTLRSQLIYDLLHTPLYKNNVGEGLIQKVLYKDKMVNPIRFGEVSPDSSVVHTKRRMIASLSYDPYDEVTSISDKPCYVSYPGPRDVDGNSTYVTIGECFVELRDTGVNDHLPARTCTPLQKIVRESIVLVTRDKTSDIVSSDEAQAYGFLQWQRNVMEKTRWGRIIDIPEPYGTSHFSIAASNHVSAARVWST